MRGNVFLVVEELQKSDREGNNGQQNRRTDKGNPIFAFYKVLVSKLTHAKASHTNNKTVFLKHLISVFCCCFCIIKLFLLFCGSQQLNVEPQRNCIHIVRRLTLRRQINEGKHWSRQLCKRVYCCVWFLETLLLGSCLC